MNSVHQRTNEAEGGLVTKVLKAPEMESIGFLQFISRNIPQLCLFTNNTSIHSVHVGDFYMAYLSNLEIACTYASQGFAVSNEESLD